MSAADGAGFIDLVFVKDEVLAEDGGAGGSGAFLDGGQVFGGALEVGIGDYRYGGGAVLGVGGGQGWRVEVGAEEALGGGRLFDFGDEADAGAAQGGGEVQGRGAGGDALAQFGQGDGGAGGCQLGALLGYDAVEDAGGHCGGFSV